jgi:cytochrome c biogenesis protein CcmG/thiol:disulfide interchange protein DsbE
MRSGLTGVVIFACAALVGLLTYGLASNGIDDTIEQSLADGTRPVAHDAKLPDLHGGGARSLADYRGKVVVLNFWASWCEPCRDEMPLLQKTHDAIEAKGGLVLGVDAKDTSEAARAFMARYDLDFPSLRDRDGEFTGEYGATGYPETFVIDRTGKIAAVRRFPVTQAWLDEHLDPVLAE